jgi:channel protein (hemolysin III family)
MILTQELCRLRPKYLYHYTSMQGLLGIFSFRELWASKIHYLNDAREFCLALELARGELEKRKQAAQSEGVRAFLQRTIDRIFQVSRLNIHVVSFSEDSDSLSQWRAYSGGSGGFALGMESTHLEALAVRQNFFLAPCVYDEKKLTADVWKVVSFAIYGATLVLAYSISTIYHSLRGPAKNLFRKLDHQIIYLLIAGTYTPFCLVTLRGPWGWSLFGIVWGLAAVGMLQEGRRSDKTRGPSVVLYVMMGWVALVAVPRCWKRWARRVSPGSRPAA